MKIDLSIIDWVALSSLATAVMTIATFLTLKNNKHQFKIAQKQSFESTLFQLFHEVKRILESICVLAENNQFSARKAFDYRYSVLRSHSSPYNINKSKKIDKESICQIYENLYIDKFSDFRLYFRSLYRVIKYIDESDFSYEEKYVYTSFIRAQLSDYELIMIFYNCTVGYGVEKFKPLIEKYALLKICPKIY